MKTTKPISTISYNSRGYLELKLRELQKAGKISFWSFIFHLAEEDEARKDHFHVYVEPSKLLQTDDLREYLKEFDASHPDKPLGCIQFVSSKFDDWYMYGLHDKRYLVSKNMSRKHHYFASDFVSSDDDDLYFKVKNIDLTAISPYQAMVDAQLQGLTFSDFFRRGQIPIPQIRNFETAWYLLMNDRVERNGRPGHEENFSESIDIDTGEIIDDVNEFFNPQNS